MKICAVLFDLDGTLADSLPFITRTYRLVFGALGLPWRDGEVVRWIGRPLKDIAAYFAGGRKEEFIRLYRHHYDLGHDRHVRLFPGTLEMLAELKEMGLRLGIVTSKGAEGTMRTVEVTGIRPYLEAIVTAQDVSRHKPDPDPVHKALALLSVSPPQAVFVGDSRYDIAAGKGAGTVTFGVTWGMAAREELLSCCPDGLLESWQDLLNRLRQPAESRPPENGPAGSLQV
jgi:pyrophosphatase PpaX